MTEADLLKDCLERLNRSGIDYRVTGSMASNYWGIPRTTHDLDFVLQLSPEAVPNLVRAFRQDFHLDEESVRAAKKPPYQFNAIDLRSSLKVDFWLPRGSLFDREVFNRRLPRTMLGVAAWVATAEDVILHKLLWNQLTPSERQCRDAAGVFQVQRGRLNLDHIEKWSKLIGVNEEWQAILEGRIRPKQT
ncbi:MAG: hypothetical protein KDM81_09380 [Verrucomicrobiae bacterium]|nr:hypothetical protein [Verrucomicrobiae bacterium]